MRPKGYLRAIMMGLLSWGMTFNVWARQDIVPGSRYTSARAAALGDAGLPLGDDIASGLFYNPALLGRVRKTQIEPVNLMLYANSNYVNSLDTNFYQVGSLSGYAPVLDRHPNQYIGGGGAFLPSFGFPGLGVGILLQSQVAAQSNSDGTVIYRSLYQVIPALGTGVRLFSGILRLGYSLQWVNQAVGLRQVARDSDELDYNRSLQQGSGFSHTFGFAVTAPIQFLPSLNLVVRNFLGTRYSASGIGLSYNVQGVPAPEPMSIDAALSLQPKLGQGLTANLIVQGRDLTNTSGMTLYNRLGFGVELAFRDRFFIRGGARSGFPTAGLAFKRPNAELSLTYYTEEIGYQNLNSALPSQSQGDTRYVLQYQMRAL